MSLAIVAVIVTWAALGLLQGHPVMRVRHQRRRTYLETLKQESVERRRETAVIERRTQELLGGQPHPPIEMDADLDRQLDHLVAPAEAEVNRAILGLLVVVTLVVLPRPLDLLVAAVAVAHLIHIGFIYWGAERTVRQARAALAANREQPDT